MEKLLVLGGIFLPACLTGGEASLCSNTVIETTATICPGAGIDAAANVSYRFATIRDLAWVLTPRSYFLSNGNQFTYRSIYECLSGRCAPDQATIEGMFTNVDFTLDDMTVKIDDGAKYIHLICTPRALTVQGLWNVITSTLKALPILDWDSIETALHQVAVLYPTLPTLIQEFARFSCHPHPLCLPQIIDTPFCSKGTRPSYLQRWDAVISWTDHISDTTGTGTGFMLSNCINEKGAWSVMSQVPQQGRDSIDEFWQIPTNQTFNPAYYTWQNYNYL
ncbi:uncharacterized protein LOC110855269 [Folsomia candida]|uniref:Uncharacterized protein n=1 Tax=Folsomia candida TaxID=158441 RepID=A0A226DR90_FOLCA|nr:uncharacterized protein LOC110855269 [Folsomia candida]OXA47719.1 hypothetical protein Fcan01_17513 [Folsomia candida]